MKKLKKNFLNTLIKSIFNLLNQRLSFISKVVLRRQLSFWSSSLSYSSLDSSWYRVLEQFVDLNGY
ncbi:hypothetical protein BpHYR1_048708 [Brachionus plicatilis]|uniref:Uncharacterized protein n=1 Tax=Brachionus plicatilis TaxID=10195 RepID=A0A3M7P6G2_BRAPC|nr:hypothetical protein BpHYR1_048708 [Brachionus plicatilis]